MTQWFNPEFFYKGLSFVRAFRDRGHEVEVLTGFPNYPSGILFDGYKLHLHQKEIMEEIPVHRVCLYPSHSNSALKRIANYLSFSFSTSVIGPWVVKKADLLYVYHPPATIYVPAFMIKLFRRMPVVYDIQDFWPDTLAATGMFNNRLGLRLVDWYCRLFYHAADRIAVLSPGFKRKLMEKRVPEKKIEVIYNWCDDSQITRQDSNPVLAKKLGMDGKFNVLFAGNMGKAQGLEAVLKAASHLAPEFPDIQFVFIGGGTDVDNLKRKTEEMNLLNVRFLPPRPPSQISSVLSLADVLLVHLKKDPLFEITIPSKIQGYMAAGKPILAAVSGDAADLISRAGAGLSCPSEDPDALVKTVRIFHTMSETEREQMGNSGRTYYLGNLSMCCGVEKFEHLFQEAIVQYKGKKDAK